MLATQFCQQSINPAFREIGVWTEGSQVWIAYGEPFTPPAAADRSAITARVLEQVNAARAHARRCGAASYPAVPALTHNALLERAALEYAQEMATFGFMSHTGRDGSAPQERITRSGYERVPKLFAIRTNTVSAKQAETVLNEVLGGSDGRPNQVFTLVNRPVLSLKLEIDEHAQHKDVYEHTLIVVMNAMRLEEAPDFVLRMAALAQSPLDVFPNQRGFFPGDNPLAGIDGALITS